MDLYKDLHIVAREFPFVEDPEPKDIVTRDWPGSNGLDAYIPTCLPVKDYPIEVTFLYKGDESSIRSDIKAFLDFLYGRNYGAVGSRLVIYNEYVGMGRKDVVVSNVSNELFYSSANDPDSVASFKIKFNVFDPTSEVVPVVQTVNGTRVVTGLDIQGIDY